jgi:hypothetical protein
MQYAGMTPNTRQPPRFSVLYGTVERALATSYEVPEAVRKAGFRSMLSNLQKLGVLGEAARVGRGAPLDYTPTEFHRFIVAIELCELGVPPATTVALIDGYWPKFKLICDRAERNNPAIHGGAPIDPSEDIVIYLGGVSLRTGSLKGARSPSIPNINHCKLGELPWHMVQWIGDTTELPPRALVVNLSARLRSFHAALAEAHTVELRAERAKLEAELLAERAKLEAEHLAERAKLDAKIEAAKIEPGQRKRKRKRGP